MNGLRLNLGCGMNRLEGYVNVDRHGDPDLRHDLEVLPWPWPDDSASEILLKHVLEHLGRDPALYLAIMKELYRVCQDGATIRIVVPHHRHEFFFNDPTHVRASRQKGWVFSRSGSTATGSHKGFSHSPLGLYLGVDFEVTEVKLEPSELWFRLNPQIPVDMGALMQQSALYNNMIQEVQITLRPVKPPGKEAR